MTHKSYSPVPDCEYGTLKETCNRANLGQNTVRKIAAEAGAVMKIGRLYRINYKKFFDYLEKRYSA